MLYGGGAGGNLCCMGAGLTGPYELASCTADPTTTIVSY